MELSSLNQELLGLKTRVEELVRLRAADATAHAGELSEARAQQAGLQTKVARPNSLLRSVPVNL